MNRQISPSDWQNLSDYLDNQLSSDAQKKLRIEMSVRPELNQALEDLRLTLAMIKRMPRQRAPKNYTLSPGSLPRRTPAFPFVPVFSVASALCTILLMLSFFFQSSLPSGSMRVNENDFAPQAKAAAPMAAESAPSAATPEVFIWGGQLNAVQAAGRGGGSPNDSSAAPALAAPPAPGAPPAIVPSPTQDEMAAKVAPTTISTSLPVPLALPASPIVADGGPILGLRPTLEQGLENNRAPILQYQSPPQSAAPQPAPVLPQTLLLIGAGLFALTAIFFGLRYRS